MPKNPDRPKIKFKHFKRPKPTLTALQRAELALQRTEKKNKINPTKVIASILKNRGLITHVAKELSIHRATLMRYIEKNEICLETLGQARDAMGDLAEKRLFEKIDEGDLRAILYYLSTVHRNRGYSVNADSANDMNTARGGPVFVETVNIVGIPSGTFLPKDVTPKENLVIDNQPA